MSFYQANHLSVPALDRSLFEGVFQVPPGHFLLADRSQIRILRYWDFDYPRISESQALLADSEYAEQFQHSLDEAVRVRLRADVPVGCYLSGGLDSCAVLGLAARHRSDPIRAFTLTFDQPAYDEGPIAREMAARAGAEYYPIPIKQSDLADQFGAAAWQSESLFLNAHGVAKFLLSKAVHDAGYKVVLTGEGSDEILAGYPHFRRDMLLYNNQGQHERTVEQLLLELEQANPVSHGLLLPAGKGVSLASIEGSLGFAPSFLESFSTAAFKLRSVYRAEFASEFAGRDPYRVFLNGLDVEGQLTGREPVNQALYLWSKAQLPNYVLTVLGDRMEMAHSVEGRVPFLDHHLVELVRDLPVSSKIRGTTEKFVLREAAKPVLTATVYARQKHPFLSPPAANAPDERLNQLLQDTLRGATLGSVPFYDQPKVIALLDSLPEMDLGARTAVDLVLMVILSACMIHEKFGL